MQAALAGLAFLTLTGAPAPAGDAANTPSVMEDDAAPPPVDLVPPAPPPRHHGLQSAATPRHGARQRG